MENLPTSPDAQVIAQEHAHDIVKAFLHYYEDLHILPEDCTIYTDLASISENGRYEFLFMHRHRGFFGITAIYETATDTLSDFRVGSVNTPIAT